jgi:hypothetical protein
MSTDSHFTDGVVIGGWSACLGTRAPAQQSRRETAGEQTYPDDLTGLNARYILGRS